MVLFEAITLGRMLRPQCTKEAKIHLRSFMREHYTDERLAWLLAHARAGKLSFSSCCCFIGIVTAAHALRTAGDYIHGHVDCARELSGARRAETAFYMIGQQQDENRRRIIIPIILAEQRRRERQRAAVDALDQFLAEKRAAKELATV
jgi:hypothetical protein